MFSELLDVSSSLVANNRRIFLEQVGEARLAEMRMPSVICTFALRSM